MVDNLIKKLEKNLFENHFNSGIGSFSGDVDFSVWADAAYLILINKLKINIDVSDNIKYIMSCQTKEGGWGITSNPQSEISFKNSILAYNALKNHISEIDENKIKGFLNTYEGNRWIDPYTKLLIHEQGTKYMYPPLILNFVPKAVATFLGLLHMNFPKLFKWSIFLFPSGWTRNAFPQLSCGGYLLQNAKRPKRLKKLMEKVIQSQLKNGSWFDTILPTIGSLYALHLYGFENDSYYIKRGLQFLKDKMRTDGGLNRFDLTVWNTSLSLIALMTTDDPDKERINESIVFLANSQNKDGGWAFSTNNLELPDHDDTALSLIALKHCRNKGYNVPDDIIKRGITFLCNRQNSDGGWAAFDKNQSRKKAGYLPPWHLEYGHELKDPSTADVTGHALWALTLYKDEYKLSSNIKSALNFLEKDQVSDGYWYGRWGLCYIYGTSRAIIAISATNTHNKFIFKSIKWIEQIQNKDGGWGENYLSYFNKTYIQGESDIVLTSWALIALMKYYKQVTVGVANGINFILEYLEEVDFSNLPTGFSAAAIEPAIYNIYYYIFPLQALSEYKKLKS